MNRRTILLVSAVLVAALGATLVFLYAQEADRRAEERFETVRVLRATALIEAGEPIADALAAGKIAPGDVAAGSRLPSALVDTGALAGASVALTDIHPGEQIIAERVGDAAATGPQLLIPDTGELAISVDLTDPARVSGFVTPGSEVSVFLTTPSYSRVLLTRVRVLGVGSTTPVSTAATGQDAGAVDPNSVEQLPRTLMTLSLTQKQAERVLYAQSIGELAVALLTDQSEVKPGPPTGLGSLFG